MTNGLTNSSSSGGWPAMKGINLVSSKDLSLGHNMSSNTQSGSIIFQEGSLDYSTGYGQEGYEIVFGSFNSYYGYTDLDAPLKLNIYAHIEHDMSSHERYININFSLTDKSGNSLGGAAARLDSLTGDVVVSLAASGMGGLTSFSIDNGETNLLSYTPSSDAPHVSDFKIRYRTGTSGWFDKAKLVKSRCKTVDFEGNVYYHCYDIANNEYEYE